MWSNFSIHRNTICIPILQNMGNCHRINVMGGIGYLPCRVQNQCVFSIEPDCTITVQNAQGRTINKLVLCLSDRKNKHAMCHILLCMLQ